MRNLEIFNKFLFDSSKKLCDPKKCKKVYESEYLISLKAAISCNFGETVPFINYTPSRETISSGELTQLRKRQISRHIIFLQ